RMRLIIVPRQRDRFDTVAELLRRSGVPFVRRSSLRARSVSKDLADSRAYASGSEAVILVDTIGELGAVWGLADIAFVGGSLDGQRGGQNMIEPAAYGAAVLFGPHTWNFRDTVQRMLDARAAIVVHDAAELEAEVARLLRSGDERRRLGDAARALVESQQ